MVLADFNSVLQVSIGLHVAYTLLPDLHGFFLRSIEEYANSAANFAEAPPYDCDTIILKDYIGYLRHLIKDRRREVSNPIIWMQVAAIIVAVLSLAILILAAICPTLTLTFRMTLPLLLITLTPMPFFCLYSYVSHRAWVKRIWSSRENVGREWTRLMQPIIEEFSRRTKS